jgi:cytidylate kinase
MDPLVHDLFSYLKPDHTEIPEHRGTLMRITVSGLPGSGTTSLSRYLSELLGFSMISAGEVFRQLADEHNMGLAEFGRFAQENPKFDKMIDARQKEIAEQRDNIIVEGRLSGWMIENADLKIWLYAPVGCRIKRIVFRDNIVDEKTAELITLERERCEAARYCSYYNIEINDLSIYQIILNSGHWDVKGLGSIIDTAIRNLKPDDYINAL